ncbi:MAG TPA: ABC transporter permease [Bryobacteraceae bacterium]|jgi:predicted permease|nr:ABC transporter permease [Bryobacteraceae bacterium]
MSLWSRIANVFRRDSLNRDIEEELQSHLAEAIAEGRDPAEARRAFGTLLYHRERSRDIRLVPWLESLYADSVFGWRQIVKRKTTSAAAILSLALAIGACLAAFRLTDAMLWRPLPISAPERLYIFSRDLRVTGGKVWTGDQFEYPLFRQMRAVVKDQAELIAVSGADRIDLTYGSDQETEKAYQQYVSGWMFHSFGIRPALGRVFTENDDLTPGAHPYAVLSYEYWKRRFAEDPAVLGRTFRTGSDVYQIIGVAEGPFTGTEPGRATDIFLPTMMMKNNAIVRSDYQWFCIFAQLGTGVNAARIAEELRPTFRAFVEERAKVSVGNPEVATLLRQQKLVMNPAPAGVSRLQKEYGPALFALGVLVMLVLLISCANVANLMTAQATARRREMALRVSIGAGRWRLVQLVVVECAWLAFFAAGIGAGFAWWAAPLVVGMIGTPEYPVRLMLPSDWRVLGFGVAMALGCTILFGLAPALRASAVKPVSALKGGDPHTRQRMMRLLVAAQVAFCVLVLFVAGLFMATSNRLSRQRTGFSAERLLTLETVTAQPLSDVLWSQVAERLRTVPGVEASALCEWPLMTGGSWNGFISVHGAAPGPVASYFLSVSPEWRAMMKIPLLQGRDFRADDTQPGSALVNESFVRQYMGSGSPVGRPFDVVLNEGHRVHYQIVGVVGDTRYRDMREPMRPIAYFPFKGKYSRATFLIRTTSANPLAMASALRAEVPRAHPGFRVSNIRTQTALIEQHTARERLLSILALFFGMAALLLAGVGLYGVLDYSVLQQQREIGIRMAIGAKPAAIAQSLVMRLFALVLAGSLIGIVLGFVSVRFIESLLFEIKATDVDVLALPTAMIFGVALLAALPAIVRSVRIDPATMLRLE